MGAGGQQDVGGAGPVEPSDAGPVTPIDEPLSDEGTVTVALSRTRQEMAGFGINSNWQPAWTDEQADTLFGTGPGQIGLTILRIGMNPQREPLQRR